MTASLPARVSIPSDVLVQELEGESVLLNLDSERYYGLDDVGTRMWQLLSEDGDVTAAFDQLLGEYEVEPDRLRQDMAEWIGRLAQAGLLKVEAPPSADEAA